jgi:hypothetical protein
MVQNLVADLGFTFGMNTPDKANNMNIGLGVTYGVPDLLDVQLLSTFTFGGTKDGGGGFIPYIYLNPELKMFPAAIIGLAIQWHANFDLEDDSHFGFNIYARKSVGTVEVKGGFGLSMAPKHDGTDDKNITFAVPIEMTYGF